MSTNHHTAIATGAAANAATINAPLGQLDAAIDYLDGMIGDTALGTAATTLSAAIAELDTQINASHYPDGTYKDASITNVKLAADIAIGSLATLATAARNSLVAAINELDAEIAALVAPSGDSIAEVVAARGGHVDLDTRLDTLIVRDGMPGGQSLSGGTAANEDIVIQGTTHATKNGSYVLLQPNGGQVSIGTTTPTYAATLGVERNINWAAINHDNIRDKSVLDPTDDLTMFCSFDTSVLANGPHDYDHIGGYQDRSLYNSSGALSFQWSFYSKPNFAAGSTQYRYGLIVYDPDGAGALVHNYAIYVANQTRGTTTNFALYVDGASLSYFGGKVGAGTKTPTARVSIARAAGATTSYAASEAYLSLGGAEFGANSTRLITFGYVNADTQPAYIGFVENSVVAGATRGALVFGTRATGSGLPDERMRISEDGYLGVLTATPATALHVAGAMTLNEMAAPGAGAANQARVYAVDNGSGKTKLMVQFATGSAIELAVEA